MRRRRQFAVGGVIVLLLLIYVAFFSGGSSPPPKSATTTHHAVTTAEHFPKHSPLNPDWTGNGKTITLGFGGDVHFAGDVGESLTKDPSTALGTGVPQLFDGTQLKMVNVETAVTDGTCPEPQSKQYIFDAPASAVTALKSATVSVATEANDHGMDCGAEGLSQNLTIASQANFPIIGIGNTAAQAFTPYRVMIDGQRVAIIAATQVIADNLINTWTASATQPGVASAIDPTELVREVQQVRRTADTVIVYVHWGTETQACPNPQQEPLAEQLVKAGADVVIGSGTHVLLGGGYLGKCLRRLRPGQPRLLRRHGARDRQRYARHHRAGTQHHGRRLAPRHHPRRRAPAADRRPGRDGGPELERRPQLHQPGGGAVHQPYDHARRDRAVRRAGGATDHHHDDSWSRHRRDHHDHCTADERNDGQHRVGQHRHHNHDDRTRPDHHRPDRQRGLRRSESCSLTAARSWTRCAAAP